MCTRVVWGRPVEGHQRFESGFRERVDTVSWERSPPGCRPPWGSHLFPAYPALPRWANLWPRLQRWCNVLQPLSYTSQIIHVKPCSDIQPYAKLKQVRRRRYWRRARSRAMKSVRLRYASARSRLRRQLRILRTMSSRREISPMELPVPRARRLSRSPVPRWPAS
jgi:hypothetical protein